MKLLILTKYKTLQLTNNQILQLKAINIDNMLNNKTDKAKRLDKSRINI